MARKVLAFAVAHILPIAAVAGIVYLALDRAHEKALREKAEQATQQLQAMAAKLQGYQTAAPVSEKKIEAALSPEAKAELEAIKKTVRNTSVALHALTEATLSSTSTGHFTPATPTTPPICEDAFNRFRVNTANCDFSIHQKFRLEGTVLRGADGKTRFFKERLIELDPVTSLPLPGEPPQLTTDVQITEEKGPEPGPFHLRAVAAANERGAFGAGVKFWSWRSLDASVLGFYDRADKSVRGAIQPGYRIAIPGFNSTISVGPNWYISSAGKTGLGVGATIELTR